MAQIYNRVKKPIDLTLVYGESSADTFEAVQLDPTIKGFKVLSYGSDGTAPQTLKTDANGRLEVHTGFDGTNYKPILTDASGQVLVGNDGTAAKAILVDASGKPIVLAGTDGTNPTALLTDAGGQLLVGNDGTAAKAILVDANGKPIVLPGTDGTNPTALLTNANGQLLVGNDGTNPTYILTNPDGTVRVEVTNTTSVAPISKANLINVTVTDSTNILASDISPTYSPTLFRIYVAFDTALRLDVVRTSGAITVVEQLNAGTNLNANAAYMFDILVDSGETINFRPFIDGTGTTTATLLKMSVVEKPDVE